MKFEMTRVHGGDGRTFSVEGIVGFFMVLTDYLNKTIACIIHDGFKKNEPVDKMEFDLDFKINGKKLTDKQLRRIIESYPTLMGFSTEALLQAMVDKLKGVDGR